ncbi:thiamine-phosphate kinase [Luteolibacter luteus]|uniref:Thiamine-monophosphate kinase n=1 Tax=Luteolibacter luteus TaxID=2728835 RepID=A0A858RJB9_9BACT|nr:thiamine-phosphate kinase [Luteolibacter luteus]QJE96614.1 thiamine-monophosphate kinase [Luteolibacter luteus]
MKKRLCDLGEDALIARILKDFPGGGSLSVGPGDDCAVVDPGRGPLRLLKTDAIIEGIHFLPDEDAEKVGWKAVARVLSDFAAMGGKPEHLLVTVAVDPDREVVWMDRLYRGIRKCLAKHGGLLAGGETSSLPQAGAVISVAGEGSVERKKLVLRSGGKPGDLVVVTGRLGGSIRGKHLTFTPRLEEAAWLVEHLRPTAMMDLSDGLAKDLPRLAAASRCGFECSGDLPLNKGCTREQALGDGEDYELLLTIPGKRWEAAADAWKQSFPKLPLTVVGRLTEPGKGMKLQGGWDHFKPAT